MKPHNQFGKMYQDEARALSVLTDGEYRVYGAILTARSNVTFRTPEMSYALIADITDKPKCSVRDAIDNMIKMGAITKTKGSKRKRWFVFGFPVGYAVAHGFDTPPLTRPEK